MPHKHTHTHKTAHSNLLLPTQTTAPMKRECVHATPLSDACRESVTYVTPEGGSRRTTSTTPCMCAVRVAAERAQMRDLIPASRTPPLAPISRGLVSLCGCAYENAQQKGQRARRNRVVRVPSRRIGLARLGRHAATRD